MKLGYTPYQYLPLFARVAIERLNNAYELRNGQALDNLLNAFAETYGLACDEQTRESAHHICSRRFFDFIEADDQEPFANGPDTRF